MGAGQGQAEDDLLKFGFKGAYMFRPGFIRPIKGVRSKTALYRFLYATIGFLFPLWKLLLPNLVTTSEILGRAMLRVAREGYTQPVLSTREINQVGA